MPRPKIPAKKVSASKKAIAAVKSLLRPAPTKGKIVAKKAAAAKVYGVRVSAGTGPGGYTVYGSALKPKHRTAAEIAAAVASLD